MALAAGGGEPMRSFIVSEVGNSKSDLPLFVFIAFAPCCNSSCTASTWLPLTAHVRAVQPSKNGKLHSVFRFFKSRILVLLLSCLFTLIEECCSNKCRQLILPK